MDPKLIYQRYLREEFERRRRRTASYSLRAFARDLAVPAPKLSQYLNGTCGLSAKRATELAQKIRLGALEKELFVCSVEASHARDSLTRDRNLERLSLLLSNTFSELNLEKFQLIRDWYHLAILELTTMKGFRSDVAWIARALSVPEDKVREALKRLVHLGLLDQSQENWAQTEKDLETPNDISSSAIRDYHQQMLELAEVKLEQVPVEKREFGSMIFSVNDELVPELKQVIRSFQKEIAALIEKNSNKNCLYTLNLQLLPIFEEKP